MEFNDKKVARSVADILNAQPIGGKKGTRWRDDVWTMKYLPKFKWNMLTEQVGELYDLFRIKSSINNASIAHEAAVHSARLRVELSQSKLEQHEYLKNVELARVLDKRRKQKGELPEIQKKENKRHREGQDDNQRPKKRRQNDNEGELNKLLGSIF